MILTAHQPVYLPWLGLFHKIALADLYCYFDVAQYQTKDFNNRNRIKTHDGSMWLSVPVESKNHFEKRVGEIRIVQNGWQRKHLKSIQIAYQKTRYFSQYIAEIESLLALHSSGTLGDLNLEMLRFFLRCLNIQTPIVKASDYEFEGAKSDLVLDMCVKLGANLYMFGAQGRNYADNEKFRSCGVEPYFQQYNHPVYHQLYGAFLPNMSVIDLLFNEGPASREIILAGNITRDSLMHEHAAIARSEPL